jgi:hypothetical protein
VSIVPSKIAFFSQSSISISKLDLLRLTPEHYTPVHFCAESVTGIGLLDVRLSLAESKAIFHVMPSFDTRERIAGVDSVHQDSDSQAH